IWKIDLIDDKISEQNHCKRIGILRQHTGAVWSVNWHWTGTYLASCVTGSSDRTVCLWDGRSGLCEHTFLGHTHSINCAIFNQQGTNVISCDSGGFIRLWDLQQRNKLGINQLVIDLNSEYIVAGCDDSKIYCIEISTGQVCYLSLHLDVTL
ncbi:unnamed protein product, partial [Schistosoma mattheei]